MARNTCSHSPVSLLSCHLLNSTHSLILTVNKLTANRATIDNEGSIDIPLLESLLVEQNICPSLVPSPTLSSTTTSTSQSPPEHHDNDPDNLPYLGEPHQVIANIGVSYFQHILLSPFLFLSHSPLFRTW